MFLSFATSLLLSKGTGEEEPGLNSWFPWFSSEDGKEELVSGCGPEAPPEMTEATSEIA